jgi:DNA-binding PadR family transcriptional regulator
MSNLSPTATIILGFLRFRSRSGYDIKKQVEVSTRFFWGASFGQIYPELRRLEEAGLVRVEGQGGRRRKTYGLTAAGERALDEWFRDEGELFQYRDEGMLRLFFSDFTEPDVALANIRRMRARREEIVAFLRSEIAPHAQEDTDHGFVFTRRALEFGTAWLEAQAQWLAALESELDDG